MLFGKYVAPSKGEPKMPMRAPEEVAKEYLDGVVGADVGGRLELPEFDYPASFPRNEGAGAVTLRGRPGDRNSPNMLLAGLERDLPLVLTRNGMLKDLIEMMPNSMCTIFAVSGQGKTRLACEALCQRFGLLLVTRQRGVMTLNPSSADVPTAIGEMVDLVTKEADEETRESIVTHRVAALLLARVLVLERLFEVTDNKLTPYQWLLAQMYPEQLLGEDVFEEVRRRIVVGSNPLSFMHSMAFAAGRVRSLQKRQPLLVFLDEAQLLTGLARDRFPSATKTAVKRDLFSAFAKALEACTEAAAGHLTHATLSGTGVTMSQLLDQVGSAMAKPGSTTHEETTFTSFEWSDSSDKALQFLALLADLTVLDKDIVTHVSGWLVGRARWAAAFATQWLQVCDAGAAGDGYAQFPFFDKSAPPDGSPSLALHLALDRFVGDMTEPLEAYQPESDSSETPRGVVAKMKTTKERTLLLLELTRAAHAFACSGAQVQMSAREELNIVQLVELGVCCLTPLATKRGARNESLSQRVSLAEPLIVEAVVRAKSWAELTSRVMGDQATASSRGVAFEYCATPLVDAIFSSKVAMEDAKFPASIPPDLKGAWRRGRSSCAVILRPCAEPSEMDKWASASRTARFDGQVAPMAAPSTTFGADLVVWARKCTDLGTLRWAFVQMKMAKSAKLTEAFRTVDPELMLHAKRDKATPTKLDAFKGVYTAFFGVEPGSNNVTRAAAFRVVINFQTDSGSSDKGKGASDKKRPLPKPVAEVVKKCKNDAVIYLARDDVVGAVGDHLDPQAAASYIAVLSGS
jgi:hypothetical protein